MIEIQRRTAAAVFSALCAALLVPAAPATAWEPSRPVEMIVPAGTGGGADQMARVIAGIITKHKLMPQAVVVINKSGGAGGEGFLDVKAARGNPHKLIITLSNLFTTPLATGIPFSWRELTPVAMMALDEFVLWVNADTPYKTAPEYIAAAKAAPAGKLMKMGGTGTKQEDQIITLAIEKTTGAKFTYVAYKGGGEVALQLVEKNVDSTVNNPIEAVAQWKDGELRPLCVFDAKQLQETEKIADNQSWSEIPTCKSQGIDVEYLMLRGIFTTPGATPDEVAYYVDVMKKVRATPEWKALMIEGAFNQTFMIGAEFVTWLSGEESRHRTLMQEAGFLAGN
jgi:putative tricarboxylic transport membrane protein